MSNPTAPAARIAALDTLRGFALLGILLLNILGFGLHSAAYFNPVVDGATSGINLVTWATVDIAFEGSMRCLFSVLFGAGVVLFTTGDNAKSAGIHYRRNFWLLVMGVLDVMVLLWDGDVLFVYAISGFMLYLVRNKTPRWLLTASGALIVLLSLQYLAMGFGLGELRNAATNIDPANPPPAEAVQGWKDFSSDFEPTDIAIETQLSQRGDSYTSAFSYILKKAPEIYLMQIPFFLLLDAVAMMLLGMALFKLDILSAGRSVGFYFRLMCGGFLVGLTVNTYEVFNTINSQFDLLETFSYTKPTYQVGRLGMAMGYLGLVMLICHRDLLPWLQHKLAAVGRMALTNYLSHSVICLFIFTGAGLGLVGQLERFELYGVVFAIWVFQLWFSDWWLQRYRFGPVEWVWRALTYGQRPAMKIN